MGAITINCDLGEWEPWETTQAIFPLVDVANIACGGHAGDAGRIRRCLLEAARVGASAGAHPGLPGAAGRGGDLPSPESVASLLEEQLTRFEEACVDTGVGCAHVKLHGLLYHAVEDSEPHAEAVLKSIARRWDRAVVLVCLAGGNFARRARRDGYSVWEELFADRGYLASGRLVPRGAPGSLWTEPEMIEQRVERFFETGEIFTEDGIAIRLRAQTICVHSDTPNAVEVLKKLQPFRGQEVKVPRGR